MFDRYTDDDFARCLDDAAALGRETRRRVDAGELVTTEALLEHLAEQGDDDAAAELARREGEPEGVPDLRWGAPVDPERDPCDDHALDFGAFGEAEPEGETRAA